MYMIQELVLRNSISFQNTQAVNKHSHRLNHITALIQSYCIHHLDILYMYATTPGHTPQPLDIYGIISYTLYGELYLGNQEFMICPKS